jgi:hypothetical protein
VFWGCFVTWIWDTTGPRGGLASSSSQPTIRRGVQLIENYPEHLLSVEKSPRKNPDAKTQRNGPVTSVSRPEVAPALHLSDIPDLPRCRQQPQDIALHQGLHPVAPHSAGRECDARSETQNAAAGKLPKRADDPTFSAFSRPKSAWCRSRPIGPMPATRWLLP